LGRYFADIIDLFNHCNAIACKGFKFGEITQNKGYYTVQGHSTLPMSVQSKDRMRLPVSD